MRPVLLFALLLAGYASEVDDATCAETRGDPRLGRDMTDMVRHATGEDRDAARAAWETYCANSAWPGRDRPFREAARVLRQGG